MTNEKFLRDGNRIFIASTAKEAAAKVLTEIATKVAAEMASHYGILNRQWLESLAEEVLADPNAEAPDEPVVIRLLINDVLAEKQADYIVEYNRRMKEMPMIVKPTPPDRMGYLVAAGDVKRYVASNRELVESAIWNAINLKIRNTLKEMFG